MDQTDVLLMSTGSFATHDWLYNNSTYDTAYSQETYSMTSPQMSREQRQGNVLFESLTAEMNSPPESADHKRHGRSQAAKISKKARSPKSVTSEEESPEEKSLRRREQNRMAQRTFRERKDRYIQTLEERIKDMNVKQQGLLTSYERSAEQVNMLYAQLLELQSELEYLRSVKAPGSFSPAPDSIGLQPGPSASHANTSAAVAMMQAQWNLQSYDPPLPDHSHIPL